MTQTKRTGPAGNGTGSQNGNPANATIAQADRPWWDPDGLHWTDVAEWWTHPALAYLAGLHDGARLERDRIAEQDEQLHRAAVRRLFRRGGESGRRTVDGRPLDGVLVQAERREFADRGEPWPGDHPDLRYPIGDRPGVSA